MVHECLVVLDLLVVEGILVREIQKWSTSYGSYIDM